MVDEASLFGLSVLGAVVGLVIMLYGVVLTAGQALNTPTVLGGVIALCAILVHTGALAALDSGHRGA